VLLVTITTSIGCHWLTRATKSCCRQSLTICAINYSGRASELGGIIDLVDQRRSNLSRCEHRHLSRAKLITRLTIDMLWKNFLSLEFRKYPYVCRYLNFLKTQCRTGHQRRQDQGNGERRQSVHATYSFTINYWSRWIRYRTFGPWLQKMLSVRRNSVPGLAVESIRMTEDRDKRRKYVHGVANPRIEDG